jgi:hypothetical protein
VIPLQQIAFFCGLENRKRKEEGREDRPEKE